MSIIKMDSEIIATIKNALTIIQLNTEIVELKYTKKSQSNCQEIINQVERIDKLLPEVKFEGGK